MEILSCFWHMKIVKLKEKEREGKEYWQMARMSMTARDLEDQSF